MYICLCIYIYIYIHIYIYIFVNRLINRNYKFQSPYKINITDVLLGSFGKNHEGVKIENFFYIKRGL